MVGDRQLSDLVIGSLLNTHVEGWMCKEELDGLSTLLNVYVTGAKVHVQLRERLFDHHRQKQSNRLTVLFPVKGGDVSYLDSKDQENDSIRAGRA